MCKVIGIVLFIIYFFGQLFAQELKIERQDFYVSSDSNIRLFVRQVRLSKPSTLRKAPILLMHGARVPGVASFDLQVPNGSLAADLAAAGYTVFVMDARGYGNSTRPLEMSQPPDANPPLVRSSEVVRDIAMVVEAICKRTGAERIALLGWATGGSWAGQYSSIYTNRVSHLILYNSLYGATPMHSTLGRGSDLEDPKRPGQFNAAKYGAYRFNTAESLLPAWDNSILIADKSEWRDPSVVTAFQQAALDSDSTARQRNPATFRAPTGALEDSFYLAGGRGLWDASLIRARTLVLRAERDFWSRPEDPKRLEEHLVHAARVQTVTIPDATHWVHLDRAERGRERLLTEIKSFLSDDKR